MWEGMGQFRCRAHGAICLCMQPCLGNAGATSLAWKTCVLLVFVCKDGFVP